MEKYTNVDLCSPFLSGPVTVPMVSQSGSPPIPMPVQVPPGHLMQQVVDENGTLRHVILSPAQTHQIHNQGGVQHHIHGPFVSIVWRKGGKVIA